MIHPASVPVPAHTAALTIAEVSRDTWFAATQLSVAPEQIAHSSAPVVYWLAESRFEGHFRPMLISRGDTPVGFLVYGIDPDDDEYWLITFMIDHRFQAQGLGRQALQAFLRRFDHDHPRRVIRLGHHPENAVAAHLYDSLGFRPTGEVIGGEVIRERPPAVAPGQD
ncbi:MAG: GNAT family N-acetyltransferase [Tessaracoccus sp.]|uniref:GNAT family N-acetyltransferase n=1 Tax=Tessaracoccus sp. TaxID=1971211 RepID=UPI001ED3E715|nr:GNAT family N-acetyltransferase [Tessaracoccus sp.]MBK7819656.1 GNAT family N-acetyltransferase [Tessaracoccus sp.]